MKKNKWFSLLTTSLAFVTLAACGNGGGATEETDYVIGTDTTFAPFEFEDDEGELVGIDIDLLAAIAEDQDFTYTLRSLGFNAAVTALEANQVDGVIAGMSITDERALKYDFSDPYYDSLVGIGVKADSDITSIEELDGEQVVVKTGTMGADYAEAVKDEYGFTVKYVEDSSTMYQDVIGGQSAAAFEDYPVIQYEIARGMDLKVVHQSEEGNSYAFATMKDKQPELVEKFNAGLKNLRESGEYDEIINRYLGDE